MTQVTTELKPLLVRSPEAARLIGVGLTMFKSMESAGKVGPLPLRFGRAKRWRVEELRRWVAAGCPGRVRWLELTGKNTPASTRRGSGLHKAV